MIKIAIIGPESTGKTELCKALAAHYGSSWVPELARDYVEQKNYHYNFEDVVEIARLQIDAEAEVESTGAPFSSPVFFDTDLIITKVWFEYKYKELPAFVEEHLQQRSIDFYLICEPDLPWEFDPVRENRDNREFFLEWYRREVEALGTPYGMVNSTGDLRVQNAISEVDNFLNNKNQRENGSGRHEATAVIESAVLALSESESLKKACRMQSENHAMPSTDVINRITGLLRAIFFPGYFGNAYINSENVSAHLGEHVNLLHSLLKQQIKAGVCFENREQDPNCKTLDSLAEEISLKFIGKLPGLRDILHLDAVAAYNGDPAAKSVGEIIFCYPGIRAIINYRVAHELLLLGVPIIPRVITELAHSETGVDIHPGATIGHAFMIDHGTGIVIGETARIGDNVRIYQGVTLGARSFPMDADGNPIKGIDRHPKVGDNVIIYSNSTILGNITVGDNAVIGGNIWVDSDVPAGARLLQKKREERVNGEL